MKHLGWGKSGVFLTEKTISRDDFLIVLFWCSVPKRRERKKMNNTDKYKLDTVTMKGITIM